MRGHEKQRWYRPRFWIRFGTGPASGGRESVPLTVLVGRRHLSDKFWPFLLRIHHKPFDPSLVHTSRFASDAGQGPSYRERRRTGTPFLFGLLGPRSAFHSLIQARMGHIVVRQRSSDSPDALLSPHCTHDRQRRYSCMLGVLTRTVIFESVLWLLPSGAAISGSRTPRRGNCGPVRFRSALL
jgi:hypothetical protein